MGVMVSQIKEMKMTGAGGVMDTIGWLKGVKTGKLRGLMGIERD